MKLFKKKKVCNSKHELADKDCTFSHVLYFGKTPNKCSMCKNDDKNCAKVETKGDIFICLI